MKGKRRRRPSVRRIAKRPPRCILSSDRRRIVRELNLRCRPDDRGDVSITMLRLRACVLIAGSSALRIGELCKLNLSQVVEEYAPRLRLKSLCYVSPAQSKGRRKGDHQWDSAGVFLLGDEARTALRAYIVEAKRRGWWDWPPSKSAALMLSVRGNPKSGSGRKRLAVRTLQWQWEEFQKHAGIDHPYHFHDLRHTAMTRCSEVASGNTHVIARYGRCDLSTAERYVHFTPDMMRAVRTAIAFSP